MGLRNLPLPSKSIEVSDGVSFAVRGLSPNDVLGLYYRRRGELSALFDHYAAQAKKGRKAPDPDDVAALGVELVHSAPQLLAEIIAIAGGTSAEDEHFAAEAAAALNLPTGIQALALQAIADLTFTSEMPAGKFLAVALRMAQSATAAIANPNRSPTG